jgi:hypothetical protein
MCSVLNNVTSRSDHTELLGKDVIIVVVAQLQALSWHHQKGLLFE